MGDIPVSTHREGSLPDSHLATALKDLVPDDFDPLDDAEPEANRVVAALWLASTVLANEKTYRDKTVAQDWTLRFEERLERIWESYAYEQIIGILG